MTEKVNTFEIDLRIGSTEEKERFLALKASKGEFVTPDMLI